MEASSSGLPLWSVVCSQLPFAIKQVACNPIVTNTLQIWGQFRKQFGLQASSGLAPVYRNHLFLPSCSDPVFRTWSDKGVWSINDLYAGGVFSSFADLANKFDLPSSHLFLFFQIRHFVENKYPQLPGRLPDLIIDYFLSLNLLNPIDPLPGGKTHNLQKTASKGFLIFNEL